MSRAKRLKMKNRLKRQVNELMNSGPYKAPTKKLVRLCKLYCVPVNKYHFAKLNKKVDAV
ncbi:MAG: hypothetical protein AB7K09_00810 [Planctomycetota bacterium]